MYNYYVDLKSAEVNQFSQGLAHAFRYLATTLTSIVANSGQPPNGIIDMANL